jgi:hypothetical protein
MVLSTAKLLDRTIQKSNDQPHQTNQAEQNTNSYGGMGSQGGNQKHFQFTNNTGPQTVMTIKMIFTTDDWKHKLTQAQHDDLKEVKFKAKAQSNSSASSSTYKANSTQSQPSTTTTATPAPGSKLCQMLSSSHSHTPS